MPFFGSSDRKWYNWNANCGNWRLGWFIAGFLLEGLGVWDKFNSDTADVYWSWGIHEVGFGFQMGSDRCFLRCLSFEMCLFWEENSCRIPNMSSDWDFWFISYPSLLHRKNLLELIISRYPWNASNCARIPAKSSHPRRVRWGCLVGASLKLGSFDQKSPSFCDSWDLPRMSEAVKSGQKVLKWSHRSWPSGGGWRSLFCFFLQSFSIVYITKASR